MDAPMTADAHVDFDVSNINLRVLGAAVAFASKDETRYYLNGVCLEIESAATTYIATDGRRLICFREERRPDESLNRLLGTFIVPSAHCKPFKLAKDDAGAASIFSKNSGRLTIAHNLVDVTFLQSKGTFPDWRKVVPPARPSGVLGQYPLKQLADFQKFADVLELPRPFVAANGPEAPAIVWFSGRLDAFGVIMPVKAGDELKRDVPTWVRRGPAREQTDVEDGPVGDEAA